MTVSEPTHLVKGNVFVTVREWLVREHGESAYADLLDAMPAAHAAEVREPMPSIWHPEEVHQSMLHALNQVFCDRDPERYREAIAELTILGVHKFARLVLQMSSNAFVLRRLPTLWRIIRRGPATTEIEQQRGLTRIRYGSFPFYGDELYRTYILGVLTGIVRISAGVDPDATVVTHGDDRMLVELRLHAER